MNQIFQKGSSYFMRLSLDELKIEAQWQDAKIELPSFDVEVLQRRTLTSPRWVHVGGGNIFRVFIADIAQKLIESGDMVTGITLISTFDYEIHEKVMVPHDNLAMRVLVDSNGTLEKRIIGSIGCSLRADESFSKDWDKSKQVFANPSLQLVSLTMTEKGYRVQNSNGSPSEAILMDVATNPTIFCPNDNMSKIVALLHERFIADCPPLAVVSMDNFSGNGDVLKTAVLFIAQLWYEAGWVSKGFLEYLQGDVVSFPCTVIDKITPRPSQEIQSHLKTIGLEDTEISVTKHQTHIAPFANAEKTQYLVIEDKFPNGRPRFEDASVYMTSRKVVDLFEKMKVCTCLNPLQTSLAIIGCLLGYNSISEEMKNQQIVEFVKGIAYEGIRVVADPGIISPEAFLHEVMCERLPNPYLFDTPQRIASDTSQKIPIRFGETIKEYIARSDLDVLELQHIPLFFALWFRYLMGIDDDGEDIQLSPDPMLDSLTYVFRNVKLGSEINVDFLDPLLSNTEIFGVNLCQCGLDNVVKDYFSKLIKRPGAVRYYLYEKYALYE